MNKDDAKLFVVLEYLPWLKNPRVVDNFKSQEEAEMEAKRLNSKSLDSAFGVAQINMAFEMQLIPIPKIFTPPLKW